MIIIFVSTPFIMLVVDPLLPENAFFPIAVSKLFYIRDTYFLYSVYFILLIVHSIKNPKTSLLQNTHFILLLRTLFSITFSVFNSRVIRLQPPAPCGIDIFISKLATNDLCTCSHQAIFWRRCRGAKRCKSFYFCLFILVLLNFVLSCRFHKHNGV